MPAKRDRGAARDGCPVDAQEGPSRTDHPDRAGHLRDITGNLRHVAGDDSDARRVVKGESFGAPVPGRWPGGTAHRESLEGVSRRELRGTGRSSSRPPTFWSQTLHFLGIRRLPDSQWPWLQDIAQADKPPRAFRIAQMLVGVPAGLGGFSAHLFLTGSIRNATAVGLATAVGWISWSVTHGARGSVWSRHARRLERDSWRRRRRMDERGPT